MGSNHERDQRLTAIWHSFCQELQDAGDLVLRETTPDSEVTRVAANGVAVVGDSVDIANARLEFASGAVANLTASRVSLSPMRKVRLFQPDA